jgi:ABC-2 type transport system permease protein
VLQRLVSIFALELRYHLRSIGLWSFYFCCGAFCLAMTSLEEVSFSKAAAVNLNAASIVIAITLFMTLVSLFMVASVVAGSVTRDIETRFGDIIGASPVGKIDLVLGRFLGALCACLIGFLLIPLAIAGAGLTPWAPAQRMGPVPWPALWTSYIYITVPIMLSLGAALFGLATLFRTTMASFVGLIAIIGIWGAAQSFRFLLGFQDLIEQLDPTGAVAVFWQTSQWSIFERNTNTLEFSGDYLTNRLLWGSIGVAVLFASILLHRRGMQAGAPKHLPKQKADTLFKPPKLGHLTTTVVPSDSARFWLQMRARTALDLKWVVTSPAFLIMLVVVALISIVSLLGVGEKADLAILPVTRLIVKALEVQFTLLTVAISIYYGGALVWRERDGRVNELVGATPVSDWTFIIPKVLAVTLVVAMTAVAGGLGGILAQLAKGHVPYDWANQFLWWVLPMTIMGLQLAALSVFVQTLAPTRFVGWAIVLAVLFVPDMLTYFGGSHPLLTYGFTNEVPLSDFNGMAHFWIPRAWVQLYWGFVSTFLVLLTWGIWKRGTETRLTPRFKTFQARLNPPMLAGFGVAIIGMVISGGFVFYNTNILNDYVSDHRQESELANVERQLDQYVQMPGPVVTDVILNVDLDTKRRIALTTGNYVVQNQTNEPIERMVVNWPDAEVRVALKIEGAAQERNFLNLFGFEVWRFTAPLQPREKRAVAFTTRWDQSGFTARGTETSIVENGTFLTTDNFAPQFALSEQSFLTDPAQRRQQGLPARPRMRPHSDTWARGRNLYAPDSGFVTADITVTAPKDQIIVSPGKQVSQVTTNERTTQRFVAEAPVNNFFSIQAARYAVHTENILANGKPVKLSIYHLPRHSQNIARMAKAARISLDLFSREFGPYQFSELKIVESPSYMGDVAALAMSGVIPFLEDVAWLQVNRLGAQRDHATSVTAHEVAHMWWGHQITPAETAGARVLTESLAEYASIMAVDLIGQNDMAATNIRDNYSAYLLGRGSEPIGENPLGHAENQSYLVYQRGSVSFWLLRNQMGQAAFHKALRNFVAQYRFKSAPFPATPDLVSALKAQANDDQKALIDILFNKIAFFDFGSATGTIAPTSDNKWVARITAPNNINFYKPNGEPDGSGSIAGTMALEFVGITARLIDQKFTPGTWPDILVSIPDRGDTPSRVTLDTDEVWFSLENTRQPVIYFPEVDLNPADTSKAKPSPKDKR